MENKFQKGIEKVTYEVSIKIIKNKDKNRFKIRIFITYISNS